MLVVIPCGSAKADTAKPAALLYLGSYFKACLRYALTIAHPDDVRILSAKHGLLRLDQVVDPYNLRMGQEGSITVERLQQQAQEQGIDNEQEVKIVAGKDYAQLALGVWTHAEWLMKDKGGMGYQIQWLTNQARSNRSNNVSHH